MGKKDYAKYYIQGSDHYLLPKDVFIELFDEMNNWKEESKKKDEVIEKAIVYAESSSFEVYTKDYGTLEVCNAIDVLDILKEVE